MWAYIAEYKTPHDDEAGQRARVYIDYPIRLDRVLGLGELPTLRLQRALARVDPATGVPSWRALDRLLVWTHWVWFMIPHCSLAYILIRYPRRFSRAAVMTYAVFDLGASVYWVAPTAPPWYASAAADGAGDELAVRRMMVEYGEHFWRDGWGPLYNGLGGNPLAAMPSLHLATSLMAALLLAETGPLAGTLGFSYALTLGFALVYLGEHYLVDLLGGAALTLAVRRLAPLARPAIARVGRAVAAVEAIAHEPA
jgi:membrane-associated phospholipid phosphatase